MERAGSGGILHAQEFVNSGSAIGITPQQSAYHWLATDGVHINPNSPQARQLAKAGMTMLRRVLNLDELSL
jgi:hypothetical protein